MIEELDGSKLGKLLTDEKQGVVIDFWSPWCAPCRALKPHLDKLAGERRGQWRFVAVNTEEHPEIAERYQVKGLPTVVWYRGGKEVGRIGSGVTVSSVAAKLEELSEA